jgi:hypothetical protein
MTIDLFCWFKMIGAMPRKLRVEYKGGDLSRDESGNRRASIFGSEADALADFQGNMLPRAV